MSTIREAIAHGETCLSEAGIPHARVDVEWLLEFVTGIRRLELPLNLDRPLSAGDESQWLKLLGERAERVPLQHLLGNVPFMGHLIMVSGAALIPRPETELLASMGIQWLQGKEPTSELRVLDFGTGTACLSVAVAKGIPNARVVAVDVSRDALELARRNVSAHELSDRIQLLESNGFDQLGEGSAFDLILSNPPYIPAEEIGTLQIEVRDFDPHLALDGGRDGLNFYRMIAEQGADYLRKGGSALMEHGDGQEAEVEAIFGASGWRFLAGYRDDNGVRRVASFHRDSGIEF